MTSPLSFASYLGHFLTHSIIYLKLFILTVLELGAPLSSFIEEVLYNFFNEFVFGFVPEAVSTVSLLYFGNRFIVFWL